MKVTIPLCVYFLSLLLWLEAGVDEIKSSSLSPIRLSEEYWHGDKWCPQSWQNYVAFQDLQGRSLGKEFEIFVLLIVM